MEIYDEKRIDILDRSDQTSLIRASSFFSVHRTCFVSKFFLVEKKKTGEKYNHNEKTTKTIEEFFFELLVGTIETIISEERKRKGSEVGNGARNGEEQG